jgi:hypothetical protein
MRVMRSWGLVFPLKVLSLGMLHSMADLPEITPAHLRRHGLSDVAAEVLTADWQAAGGNQVAFVINGCYVCLGFDLAELRMALARALPCVELLQHYVEDSRALDMACNVLRDIQTALHRSSFHRGF